MKFSLPPPPVAPPRRPGTRREMTCRQNAWLAHAGWRLRTQIAARARIGQRLEMCGPVVVAMAVPEGRTHGLGEPAGPVLELLCRHGVIASKEIAPIRGISLVWHDAEDIEVTLEPAPLGGPA
jgi:hypothetical protein